MSDYKKVNGKKVRVCKFGCDTELVWSDDISGFIETEGKIAHTKDRCKQVKDSKSKQENNVYSNGNDLSLELAFTKLVSIGIQLDLAKLRNVSVK